MSRRRIALAGLGVALAAATAVLAACSGASAGNDDQASAPTGSPARTSTPGAPPAEDAPLRDDTARAQGFDIRHLGEDGTIKTLKVRDFPR